MQRLGVLSSIKPKQAFLLALVIVLAGLFIPHWIGSLILFCLAAALLALLTVTWRTATPVTILFRLAILAALVLIALYKL